MTIYAFEAVYYTSVGSYAVLPDGRTWSEIEDWFIKWDTLHVKFKDVNDWCEVDLNSNYDGDCTDWKRPANVAVYEVDKDGEADYSREVARMEG